MCAINIVYGNLRSSARYFLYVNVSLNMLKFEITKTTAAFETEKKYILYTIVVSKNEFDDEKSSFERRYTHFYDLYNNLKKEYPALMNSVNFPKKVVLGNFEPDLISSRSNSFQLFLYHITNDCRLRDAPCSIDFFQNMELSEAKKLIENNKYDKALSLLENIFKLLNKIYMDRSRVVLISLCRLVACGASGSTGDMVKSAALAGPVERWATLAMHRFDAVSDTDILSLYVPLIQACISIWKTLGKDCKTLELNLGDMKRRGIKVDACLDLMQAIDYLEECTDN